MINVTYILFLFFYLKKQNKNIFLFYHPTMMRCHIQLTWRAFWAQTCPEVVGRTLCRLQPLAAASAGRLPRCWRDKRSPRCWKRDRPSPLSRCWQRETSVGPGNQIKRCWGSHARWLPRCCDSCLRAGQTEGWNPGSGFQTQHFPAVVSPARQCRTAGSLSPLPWCSSAGTVESLLCGNTPNCWYLVPHIINHLHVGSESMQSSLCDVTKVTDDSTIPPHPRQVAALSPEITSQLPC